MKLPRDLSGQDLVKTLKILYLIEKQRKFMSMSELPIIQKTYDLIKWYVPILNRLPRDHKFTLGDRIITGLYDLLEGLILARYATDKLNQLELLNGKLDILRHQTRLLLDFELIKTERYEYIGKLINEIGTELGAWIKQQRNKPPKL
ncbi:conserved hypothetical protein [Planktothrix sp. PCC 11201]|uniref:diversity-generating retroelement protein Avd n=1 Tax=Planktothrix sp. PCC 11201 TaxID=1729650 RepID=UPI000919BFCB|nr:diversity-generating retroelement protein Avd [Planktothrix sp. PCC 11201]SKB15087.1 conserved hypothetical protein [Planktothrix sp. PCC 11201]